VREEDCRPLRLLVPFFETPDYAIKKPMGVEKLAFLKKAEILGDRKSLGDVEKSFVELPNTI
jgi:hypothetical protein